MGDNEARICLTHPWFCCWWCRAQFRASVVVLPLNIQFYTFYIRDKFFKIIFKCFCFPSFFSPATWRRRWWGSAYSRCLGFALVTFLSIGIILMTWVEIGVMIKNHIQLNDDFADD